MTGKRGNGLNADRLKSTALRATRAFFPPSAEFPGSSHDKHGFASSELDLARLSHGPRGAGNPPDARGDRRRNTTHLPGKAVPSALWRMALASPVRFPRCVPGRSGTTGGGHCWHSLRGGRGRQWCTGWGDACGSSSRRSREHVAGARGTERAGRVPAGRRRDRASCVRWRDVRRLAANTGAALGVRWSVPSQCSSSGSVSAWRWTSRNGRGHRGGR